MGLQWLVIRSYRCIRRQGRWGVDGRYLRRRPVRCWCLGLADGVRRSAALRRNEFDKIESHVARRQSTNATPMSRRSLITERTKHNKQTGTSANLALRLRGDVESHRQRVPLAESLHR